MRFCGAGAGMSAVLRKGAVLGNGAGVVMARVKFFAHFGHWNLLQFQMLKSLK